MTRTVTVGDRAYTVAPMTFAEGRAIFQPNADPFDSNCAMVAACLNNASVARPALDASATLWTAESVGDLPYPDGAALVLACMELNGLKQREPAPSTVRGEAEAAQAAPALSNSEGA